MMPGNYWKVITSDDTSFLVWTRNTVIIAVLTMRPEGVFGRVRVRKA